MEQQNINMQQQNANVQQQNAPAQQQAAASNIDWQQYINKAWKGRKTIICTTLLFIILGLVYAFTMKRLYKVEVLLAPELNSSNRGGGLSGIASMLGMGGVSSNGTTDAYNITMYPKVISSTPFLAELVNIHVKDPDIENPIDTTLVGYMTRKKGFSIMSLFASDEEEKPDWNHINPQNLTKPQSIVLNAIGKSIDAQVDNKTGETTITVTMDNPYIAATLADSVCSKLRKYIISYRTSKAREDLAYYQKLADESYIRYKNASSSYASYQDHNRGLILNAVISEGSRMQNELSIATQVYTQMKQQAEMARAKVQEDKPIFATIQPASVPLRPSNSRAKVLVIFTFLGFALSTVWVIFGNEYLGIARKMLKDARSAAKSK